MEKNDNKPCRLSTKEWDNARQDAAKRKKLTVNYGPRMPTPKKTNIEDRLEDLTIKTPLKMASYSKSVSSSSRNGDLTSPGFNEATLKDRGIEYLRGMGLTDFAKHPSFKDLPFIIFSPELPLVKKYLSDVDLERVENELADLKISKDYAVHWLDENDTFLLRNSDVDLQYNTGWEIEDYLGRNRCKLIERFLEDIFDSSDLGEIAEEPVNYPIRNLVTKLFFRSVGNNHKMQDPGQSTIRCSDLKPDFVAGPFSYINHKESVASLLSPPIFEEIASFLSTLQKVPGTTALPMPFLVGELKKQGAEDRAEDGYKVFVEMATIRSMHEAFFEKAPKYTFGIHQAHHEWQIYAMTTAHDPTRPWKKFDVAQIFKGDDSTCLGAIYIATVMLRLATYVLWQMLGLKLVSKDKQEELRAIYGDKSKKTNATCSKRKPHKEDHHSEDDDDQGDDDNDGRKDRTESSKTSGSVAQSAKSNTTGGSQQSSNVSNTNIVATLPLSELRHLADNIYLAKHHGEDCVIKVAERRKVKNEYNSYKRLQGSPYVAKMLAAYKIDDTFDCLVLKQYDQLPAAKSPEDVLLITEQLLTILSEMHALGLAHRDIKNSNIMWDEASKCIKLIDFETCTRVPSGAYFKPHLGTELFKAPEQLAGWWCSLKVDVFSAGLVCAAMMYGGRIKTKEGRDGVLEALETSYSPDSPTFVKSLLPLFKQMTATDSKRRISASDALGLIKAITASAIATIKPSQNPVLRTKSGRSKRTTVNSGKVSVRPTVQATEGHPSKQFSGIKVNSFVPVHDDKENHVSSAKSAPKVIKSYQGEVRVKPSVQAIKTPTQPSKVKVNSPQRSVPIHDDKENQYLASKSKKPTVQLPRSALSNIMNSNRINPK